MAVPTLDASISALYCGQQGREARQAPLEAEQLHHVGVLLAEVRHERGDGGVLLDVRRAWCTGRRPPGSDGRGSRGVRSAVCRIVLHVHVLELAHHGVADAGDRLIDPRIDTTKLQAHGGRLGGGARRLPGLVARAARLVRRHRGLGHVSQLHLGLLCGGEHRGERVRPTARPAAGYTSIRLLCVISIDIEPS
jgi:hypothetical protein